MLKLNETCLRCKQITIISEKKHRKKLKVSSEANGFEDLKP